METSSPPSYYYSHLRQEMLAFLPSEASRILDVGCGAGGFIKSVKDTRSCECWGVELNEIAATQASTVADKVLYGDVFSNIQNIPDGKFDCIFFNDVLEHVVEPLELMDRLRPKLKPNALLIASVPNVRYIKNLFNLIVRSDWKYESHGVLDQTHLRFFTKKSMTRSLEHSGWAILRCEGLFPTRVRFIFAILNLLSFGFFADTEYMNFVFVCKSISEK